MPSSERDGSLGLYATLLASVVVVGLIAVALFTPLTNGLVSPRMGFETRAVVGAVLCLDEPATKPLAAP